MTHYTTNGTAFLSTTTPFHSCATELAFSCFSLRFTSSDVQRRHCEVNWGWSDRVAYESRFHRHANADRPAAVHIGQQGGCTRTVSVVAEHRCVASGHRGGCILTRQTLDTHMQSCIAPCRHAISNVDAQQRSSAHTNESLLAVALL